MHLISNKLWFLKFPWSDMLVHSFLNVNHTQIRVNKLRDFFLISSFINSMTLIQKTSIISYTTYLMEILLIKCLYKKWDLNHLYNDKNISTTTNSTKPCFIGKLTFICLFLLWSRVGILMISNLNLILFHIWVKHLAYNFMNLNIHENV